MDPIEVLGLVAWRRVAQSGEPAGVGVSLSHDGQRRLPQLRALLASSLAASDRLPNREAGYRILITDDSPNTSSLYRYAMRKLAIAEWGKPQPGSAPSPLTVDHASDGDQAFRLVQERSYALVITDLYMPVLDGFALIDRMRAAPALSATRILVISAGDDALLERAKEMGADAVLQKPAKVADVVSAARALLRLQRGA